MFSVFRPSFEVVKFDSMKVEVICKENNLKEILGIVPLTYENDILEAFEKIEMKQVPSNWKDALTTNTLNDGTSKYAQVPVNGFFFDPSKLHVRNSVESLKKIWSIGGKTVGIKPTGSGKFAVLFINFSAA